MPKPDIFYQVCQNLIKDPPIINIRQKTKKTNFFYGKNINNRRNKNR